MTTFGWDASHYDGRITKAIAARARAEGIDFATHKLGEGGNYIDPLAGANLTAFRDAGMPVIGAYYVPRTPGVSIPNQVAHCISTADKLIPWWRTYPGFFWQDDLELWDYDQVSAKTGITFGQLLAIKSGKPVALYASKGMYGNQLAGWKPGLLWNANYGQNPTGQFRDIYPGDRSTRWAAYSGMVPTLLQYGSKATIAGLTTCDANAFRGTLADLLTLITGAPAAPADPGGIMAGFDKNDLHTMLTTPAFPASAPSMTLGSAVYSAQLGVTSLVASQAAQDKTLAALLAAVTALASGGTSVDTAAVLAAVHDEGAKESARVADLLARLAVAEKAHADALAAG